MRRSIRTTVSIAVIAAGVFCTRVELCAQSGENVAVVINEASPASIEIGEYYASRRSVPAANVIRILAPLDDSLSRAAYVDSIERPIAAALRERVLADRVLYIVLTKGVPLRISGRLGARGDAASVDSELTLLYRRMTGRDVLVTGTVDNPYYADARPVETAAPFSRRAHDIYLVTRLDGFTIADVKALVDRALSPSREGRIVLDRRPGPTGTTERWLADAAARLRQLGNRRVDLVQSLEPSDEAVLGYFSSGSNDPDNRQRRLHVRFSPGAIAATLAGPDARTFAVPPDDWQPGAVVPERGTVFANSTHSLIADLIRDGVTGVAGNASDPLLSSAIRPQVLFAAYLAGSNLAEAFYLALPHLSWQSVIVGDPLCRPFSGRALAADEIEAPIDEATGLPGFLSARRLEVARERNPGTAREVLALTVRADE